MAEPKVCVMCHTANAPYARACAACGVSLAPEEQAKRVKQTPTVFVPAKGAWGEQGSTLVKLEAASVETVRPAIRAAWERLVREETAAQGKQGAHKKPPRPKRTKI